MNLLSEANKIFELKNWHLTGRGSFISLSGEVYGHPRFDDGEYVRTSAVEKVDKENRLVKTFSGSYYHLDSTGDIEELPERSALTDFREYWVGRLFLNQDTGETFQIPASVWEGDFFSVGDGCFVDVGRWLFYSRYGGNIVDITPDTHPSFGKIYGDRNV